MDEFDKQIFDLVQRFPYHEDFMRAIESLNLPENQKADVFLEAGIRLYNFSYFKLASELYTKALRYYIQSRNRLGESGCYGKLGNVYHRLGDYRKAIEYHEKSLEITRQIDNRLGEAYCYGNLGSAYHRLGDYWKAIEYHKKSLEINRQIGNRLGESSCLGNLGYAYDSIGDYRKAIKYYERSLEINKEIGDRLGESRCYGNLGLAYNRLGDNRKTIEYQAMSLEIKKEIGDRLGESRCYGNLGNAYDDLGDYLKAIEYHKKSLEIAKEIVDRLGESMCYNNLGIVYYGIGDYLKAIEYYEKSLNITRQTEDRFGESSCYNNLGMAYRALGDYLKSIGYYKKSLELYHKIGAVYGKKNCLSNIGRAYLDKTDFSSAEKYLKEAISILEVMRADNIPKEYKKDFWRDNIGLFDNLVITEVKLDKHKEALEYSERGKGRTILDLILNRGIEEKTFKTKPLDFMEIEGLCQRIQRNMVLLRVTPKGTYVFILILGAGFNYLEITDFDTKILDDLLLRFDGDKPIDGWIYRYSNYKSVQHKAKQLLTQRKPHDALNLLKTEEANWFNSMDDTLKRLYDELLEKVFDKFKTGEKVVVIPNRSLNILPLHACFYKENGNRRYLLEDYEITYAPNCNLLDLCYRREEDNRARDSLFAIANPTPPFDLIFSEWEIEEIGRLFQDREVHIREEVKDRLLTKSPDHGIIHLSTHGIYDLGSSFNSRLLLGKDTDLTLTEIFEKVRLDKSWLVTLSACESGLTDYRDIADESIGLQTGFLYAGAPTVIASLWSVNDFTTALVMIKTYENIFRKGLSKAESLRSAQLWLKDLTAGEALEILEKKQMELESSTRMAGEDISPLRRLISLEDTKSKPFSHPYYWSGFQVFGV